MSVWKTTMCWMVLPCATGIYLVAAVGDRGGGGQMSGRNGHAFDQMSPDDRRASGIDNLTPDQRDHLDSWINQHYAPSTHPIIDPNRRYHVVENLHGGSVIKLDDGSVYNICPDDIGVSSAWILPFPLIVQESNDPQYPYVLINENTGSSVKATQAQPGTTSNS